jgi:hypothetical protein
VFETSEPTLGAQTLNELKQLLDSFPSEQRGQLLAAIRDVMMELPSLCCCLTQAASA